MPDNQETPEGAPVFNFAAYPPDTLFHERRSGLDRRQPTAPATEPTERRSKQDRRRRVDPTTFEKQYTVDELEFMNAMQRFKLRSGKSFPSYRDVLQVAAELGYRQVDVSDQPSELLVVRPDSQDQ